MIYIYICDIYIYIYYRYDINNVWPKNWVRMHTWLCWSVKPANKSSAIPRTTDRSHLPDLHLKLSSLGRLLTILEAMRKIMTKYTDVCSRNPNYLIWTCRNIMSELHFEKNKCVVLVRVAAYHCWLHLVFRQSVDPPRWVSPWWLFWPDHWHGGGL